MGAARVVRIGPCEILGLVPSLTLAAPIGAVTARERDAYASVIHTIELAGGRAGRWPGSTGGAGGGAGPRFVRA
jgi:hypothetical protein